MPTYQRVLISVSDGKAVSELPAFDLVVQGLPPANTAPTIGGSPAGSVVAGNSYEFIPQVTDPDGQTLVFSITGRPAWAQFDTVTGRLWGTPAAGDVGTSTGIVISVSDGVAQTALPAFDITVTSGTTPGPTNRAPVISGSPAAAVAAGQAYSFLPTASDPDGQALTFSISNRPTWANFNTSTGQLSGTPGAANVGPHANIMITVSDGAASASLPAFSITVIASNNPPDISGTPPTQVVAGQATASRPPPLTRTARRSRSRSRTARHGRASARRRVACQGHRPRPRPGRIRTSRSRSPDGAAQDSLPPFTIVVSAPNRPPVISGSPATSVTVGQAYSFTPTASDPDGQALTFSIANRPSWATFSTSTGRLSGTPAAANAGSYSGIVISVSDGTVSASLPSFTLVVQAAANRPPVISGSPATSVTVGQAYSFTPTASDPDGQPLTFSIANRPAWATFSTSTGQLSGTPAAANAGSYSGIVISVSDGTASASLPSFTLAVQQVQMGSATIRWTPPTEDTTGAPLDRPQRVTGLFTARVRAT